MSSWQVQQVKSRLSEVLQKAQNEGPQTITKHGVEQAVLLSMDEYRELTAHIPSIIDVLMGGPKFDDDQMPDFERQPDPPRDLSGLFDDE